MQEKLITFRVKRKIVLIENLSFFLFRLFSSVFEIQHQNRCTFNHKISSPFVVFFCSRCAFVFISTLPSSELGVFGLLFTENFLLPSNNYSSWCKRQGSGMEFWSFCDPCERVSHRSVGRGKREFIVLSLCSSLRLWVPSYFCSSKLEAMCKATWRESEATRSVLC